MAVRILTTFYPYFSPSGIQLKTLEEIKDYLATEGTCKCGLNCPLSVQNAFDFDNLVRSTCNGMKFLMNAFFIEALGSFPSQFYPREE